MKIALPSAENQIDSHFGHCAYYTVFTVNDSKEIVGEETVASPQGCGCKSNIAQTLSAMGVNLMLAGNIGGGAINVLNNSGIEVVRGCSGDVHTVVNAWLSGTLTDSGETCHSHDAGHECSHN
jgi:predicted Fe-Mo cluster-binding NifX family protein